MKKYCVNHPTQEDFVCYQGNSVPPPPFVHGFTTRIGGVSEGDFSSLNLAVGRGDSPQSVAQNYKIIEKNMGISPLSYRRNAQIHGDSVHVVTSETAFSFPDFVDSHTVVPQGDGLVTQERGILLWVYGADCVPILFYDPVALVIGAVHAGWRGTAKGIASKMIHSMTTQFSSHPQNIQVIMGPSIGPCCFMCSEDVPQGMMETLGSDAQAFCPPHPSVPDKYAVNLWELNGLWLKKSGVPPENIQKNPPCTACHLEEFWSHRKLGEHRGAQGAFIYLKTQEELE